MAKLLLIEGDERKRFALARELRREGHQVFTADNAATALAVLAQESFDRVLLNAPGGGRIAGALPAAWTGEEAGSGRGRSPASEPSPGSRKEPVRRTG